MAHPFRKVAPLAGLLIIQPLSGDREGGESEVKRKEEEILPFLGRADLVNPDKVPPPDKKEGPGPPDEDPNKPAGEGAKPNPDDPDAPKPPDGEPENLPDDEADQAGPGVLPSINAGDGPGVLEGVVSGPDGKTLPGVIVTLPDQESKQVSSGPDGSFRFTGLPATGITVLFQKNGFKPKEEVIQIRGEGITKVGITIELQPVELADGEYLLDTEDVILDPVEEGPGGIEIGATETPGFVSGLGQDDFRKQSLTNAADAVGRVSGANVVDGKYAVVRGLADRYVTTSFNNGAITSADPSRKTVQLDLFPTSVLQGISVKKVYDASMPGDFGGGAINIETLSMPEERFLTANYRIGWNGLLEDEFYRSNRSLGFLGDVDNPVPRSAIFDSNGNFPGGSGTSAPDPEAEQAWDFLLSETSFVPRRSKPRPSQDFWITYGDRFEFENDINLGFVVSASRLEEDSMQLNRIRSRPGLLRSWVQDDYSSLVDWGLFLSAQIEFGDAHKISATYFRKRVAEDQFSLQRNIVDQSNGINFGIPASRVARDGLPEIPGVRPAVPGFGADAFYSGEAWQTDTTIRDLELFQVSGQHEIWEDGLTINWGYTTNNSSESRPYSTALRYGVLDFAHPSLQNLPDPLIGAANTLNTGFNLGLDNPTFEEAADEMRRRMILGGALEGFLASIEQSALQNAPVVNPDLGQVPTLGNTEYTDDSPGNLISEILNQRIEEVTEEQYVDALLPIKLGEDREFRLGLGLRSSIKERKSRGQRYIVDANTLPDELLYDPDGIGTQIPLDPSLWGSGTNGGTSGITLEDGNALEVRNFDGNSDLFGLYLKGELDWDDYTFGAGFRREEETRSFFTLPAPLNLATTANRRGEVTNVSNIPSLYIKRSFDEDRFRVGAFFSRTVARPTFFEFLPARSIEQDTGFERRGDFGLRDTTITNFDLTFDWDITPESRITIAPFYKYLEDPIISVVRRSQSFIGFQNGEEGTLQGVELEFDIGDFKPFTFRGNYTFIDAELIAEINQGAAGFQPVSLQYPNQPEHIINLILGYEHEDSGWSGNLVYNFTGENALFLRISESDASVITPSFETFDLNVQKKFEFDNMDLTLRLSVNNIFDTKAKVFFDGGGTSFEDEIFDVREPGRTFSLEGTIQF